MACIRKELKVGEEKAISMSRFDSIQPALVRMKTVYGFEKPCRARNHGIDVFLG